MNFSNIKILNFGEAFELYPGASLCFFEPVSLWNDSLALLDFEGFKCLNINDAGINFKLLDYLGSVDLIMALFSPGASGYPATWTNLNDEEKREIYKNYGDGIINMLKNICESFGAKFLLPFASHFTLHHPEHLKYLNVVKKNTIFDLRVGFVGTKTKLIDLMHGESFDLKTSQFKRKNYSQDELLNVGKFLEKNKQHAFKKYYPSSTKYKANYEQIKKYFENLNLVPEIIFCEDMVVSVKTFSYGKMREKIYFEIKNGRLRILKNSRESCDIKIKMPHEILSFIILENESWDEAIIGYWCEFYRQKDLYHANFFRLLQAPFYLKSPRLSSKKQKLNFNINLAELLEKNKSIPALLSRYGLYCCGCNYAPQESLANACDKHGLSQAQREKLLKDLESYF